jgi:hypothetical protein
MQQNELKIWFKNLDKDIKNETKLIINSNYYSTFPRKENKLHDIVITPIDNYLNFTNYKYSKLMIFLNRAANTNNLFNFLISNEFIFVENDIDIIINYLKNAKSLNDFPKEIDNITYKFLKKINFSELINMNKKEIETFIYERIKIFDFIFQKMNSEKFEESFDKKFELVNSLFNISGNFNLQLLEIHLEYIKEKKILSAKFAHFLYRLANLDFLSSSTAIGRKISSELGIRSKGFSFKKTEMYIEMNVKKDFKAYDLHADKHLEVKKKIAQKLILLNDNKLDIDKIAEITELPTKEVKKLFNR